MQHAIVLYTIDAIQFVFLFVVFWIRVLPKLRLIPLRQKTKQNKKNNNQCVLVVRFVDFKIAILRTQKHEI